MELKFREYKNSFANEVRGIINSYDNQPFTVRNVLGDINERWHFMDSTALYDKVRYSVHYLYKAGEIEEVRRVKNATVFKAIVEDKYVHFKE